MKIAMRRMDPTEKAPFLNRLQFPVWTLPVGTPIRTALDFALIAELSPAFEAQFVLVSSKESIVGPLSMILVRML